MECYRSCCCSSPHFHERDKQSWASREENKTQLLVNNFVLHFRGEYLLPPQTQNILRLWLFSVCDCYWWELELSPLNTGTKFTWSVHAGSRLQTDWIAGHQPVMAAGSARTLPLMAESWWVMISIPMILYNQKSICCVELVLGARWYFQYTWQHLAIVLPPWQQLVVLQPCW